MLQVDSAVPETFHCDVCDRDFTNANALGRHMTTKTHQDKAKKNAQAVSASQASASAGDYILELEPLRLDAAKGMANIKGLMNMPWGNQPGAPTLGLVLAIIEHSRVTETNKSGISFMWTCWTECKSAKAFGEKHRRISGWHEDLDNLPEELKKAFGKGCPKWFLGVSIASTWKVARYLLWCEVPEMVEADLVVSHHRQMLKLAAELGIAIPILAGYAHSKLSVKETRTKKALEYNVSESDVKLLFTSVGVYGSNGVNWMHDHDAEELCDDVNGMKAECRKVADSLWSNACPQHQAIIMAKKPRDPAVSYLATRLALKEREDVDKIDEAIGSMTGSVVAWLGDCSFARGAPGYAKRFHRIEAQLAVQGILVSAKELPRGAVAYMAWLKEYMQSRQIKFDMRQCDARDSVAFKNQMMFISWLYKSGDKKDLPRGGVPHGWAAYGILPNFSFYVDPDSQQVQYFLAEAGRWIARGGEKLLAGEGLEELLQQAYSEYRWELVWSDRKQKSIYSPVKSGDHPLMSDNTFKKNVGSTLRGAALNQQVKLDSTSRHKLLFQNGLLIDFDMPFASVKKGVAADRISRCSKWEFLEWEDQLISEGMTAADAQALQDEAVLCLFFF